MKTFQWTARLALRASTIGLCLTLLNPAVAQANDSNSSQVAYIPANWVDFVEGIYPVAQAPTNIRREVYKSVKILRSKPNAQVVIEAHGATQETAEKVMKYFVEKRRMAPARFSVQEKFDRPDLEGWIVIRLRDTERVAEAPNWEYEMIRTSLASPVRTEGATSSESLAGVMKLKPISFRPAVGFGYLGVQTDPKGDSRISPDWFAINAEIETAFINTQIFQAGLRGHYLGSIVSMNEDSTGASAVEASAGTFFLVQPEPTVVGAMRLQLDLGFYGNWRWFEDGSTQQFVEPIRALAGNVEVSTSFDNNLRFGLNAGVVFQGAGTFQAGGFISHRLFSTGATPWDIRLGLNTSIARIEENDVLQEENWSNFQIGITGSI